MSGGSTDLGHFVGALESPICDYELAGNGYEMTDGTLVAMLDENGYGICDTDLYFNLGDHETSIEYCLNSIGWSVATYGPVWNRSSNNGCDFDDPGNSSLGPIMQCESCDPGTDAVEAGARGFGQTLGLNTGVPEASENYLQMYVR